jgi:transcription attenuation protein (tryptophan RNA-binding attenuator protein)
MRASDESGPVLTVPLVEEVRGDYVAVRALEDGVTIIGLTRGRETKFHHTEKLDRGEVMLLQFTELTAAVKLRGRAVVYCKHGQIPVGPQVP